MSDDVMVQNDQVESATEEIPADYDISIGGVACTMKFLRMTPLGNRAMYVLQIPVKGIYQVMEVLPHTEISLPGNSTLNMMAAMDDAGKELFTGYGAESLKREHTRYLQAKRSQKLQEEYLAAKNGFDRRIEALKAIGQVIIPDSVLGRDRRELNKLTAWKIVENHSSGKLPSLVRAIKKELDRLEEANPYDEFVKGLLSGSLPHRHSDENKLIIDKALMWSIRTGGFIEPISDERLEKFYRDQITAATTPDELPLLNLRLDPEVFLPDPELLDEIAADPQLGLAPDEVMLPGNKGEAVYRIKYDLVKQGDKEIPAGIIDVPLSVYKKLAPEYAKQSGFPTLPYDIQLFIRVTCDGKLIAEGFDSLELADKVRKVEKAKARRKFAGLEGGESLITGAKLEPSTLPDHAKVRRAGRRR